jgi:predicted transcriptional regulator
MKAHNAFIRKVLLQKVLRKFAFYDISPVYRAPFDFIMNFPKSKRAIVGSVAARDERNLDKRIEEIVSVCTVIHAHPVLITEKSKVSSKDMSCVCMDELSAMRTPKDLVATA